MIRFRIASQTQFKAKLKKGDAEGFRRSLKEDVISEIISCTRTW